MAAIVKILAEVGRQTFFTIRKYQIANRQISQICQSANPQNFIINPKIVNPSNNTQQLCLEKLNYMYSCIYKDNKYVFADLRKFFVHKRLGPQISSPQSVPFAEGPQIQQSIKVRKFEDLRNFFADRPPLIIGQAMLDLSSSPFLLQE